MKCVTTMNQIEVTAGGIIFVELFKQIVSDDGKVMFSEPHRYGIEPGVDIDHMHDLVNKHLAGMGYPPAPQATAEQVKAIASVI